MTQRRSGALIRDETVFFRGEDQRTAPPQAPEYSPSYWGRPHMSPASFFNGGSEDASTVA